MRRLGIGEVCRLLDIKPHILRYWEQEISLLEPPKNVGGRRVYGDREMHLLYRLKYLVQERRFTVEGAKIALLDELSGQRGNEKAEVLAMRKHLLDALEALRHLKEKNGKFTSSSLIPAGQAHLRRIWERLPEGKRRNLSDGLLALSPKMMELAASLEGTAESEPGKAERVPVLRRTGRPGGPGLAEAEKALAGGTVGAVTIMPAASGPPDVAGAMLRRLAGSLRDVSLRYGTALYWYLFSAAADLPRLKSLFRAEEYYFLDPSRIVFVREPLFPYLDGEKRLLVQADGRIASYSSGCAGALLLLTSRFLQRTFEEKRIETLYFLPLNRFSLRFPDIEMLSLHFGRGADLSLLCLSRGKEGFSTTGNYIAGRGLFSSSPRPFPAAREELGIKALIPGVQSAEEIGEFPVRKISSGLYGFIGRAERAWALAEES